MTGVNIDIRRKDYQGGDPASGPVIQNLRLAVRAGEFVCLVGASGCGKTTLLNLVAGLDRDFEGAITYGLPTSTEPRLGYVFQNPRLLPWRTVRENIALALAENHDPAYVDHLFEIVGLTEAREVYPERLSLGMSRRAALVRAFAINPDLLLMDEPLVSLDPPTARRIRELIIRLWQERPHTVLFVTHDLREAIELGDRLVFLDSAPAQVIGDIAVDVPRQQRDAANIEAFRRRLLEDYPAIAGLL
jgi:ABC-type nitrate/sulfonate/bicarbonate transport system ATPase subunit